MRTILTVLLLLGTSSLQAREVDATLKEYRAALASKDANRIAMMKLFVSGAGQGLVAAVTAQPDGHALFCVPAKLEFDTDTFVRILDRAIQELSSKRPKGALDEAPLVVLLMAGMKDTFPCKAK